MKIKTLAAIGLLSFCCVFTQPVFATEPEQPVTAEQTQEQTQDQTPEQPETQEPASEATMTEQPAEEPAQQTDPSLQEQMEDRMSVAKEKARKQTVIVLEVFQFSDGSFDVWRSGTGLLYDDTSVLVPSALVSVTQDDSYYSKLARNKQEEYARIGVDLTSLEDVQDSFHTYIVTEMGDYVECTMDFTSDIGLTMLTHKDTCSVDQVQYGLSYSVQMLLSGYDSNSIAQCVEGLNERRGDFVRPDISTQTLRADVLETGDLTGNSSFDLGYTGAVLYNEMGEVCGMIITVSENKASYVNQVQIQNFADVESEEEADNSEMILLNEQIEKLEQAVAAGKELDTSIYTEESSLQFAEAVGNAEKVLSDINAQLVDVESAIAGLEKARAGLAEAPQGKTLSDYMDYATYAGIAIGALLLGLIFIRTNKKKKESEQPENENSGKHEPSRKKNVKGKKEKKETEQKKTPAGKKEKGFFGNRKKKKEDVPEKNNETVSGYGGKHARALEMLNQGDSGEEGTTILSKDEGEENTTLLSTAPVFTAYLTGEDGERIDINKEEFKIGKERRKVDYCITGNTTVSRVHCILKTEDGETTIEDNGSMNGTMVNNTPVDAHVPVMLNDGDFLVLSDVEFVFHAE